MREGGRERGSEGREGGREGDIAREGIREWKTQNISNACFCVGVKDMIT